MADFVKGIFGAAKSAASSVSQAGDTDFADFADYATAASPAAPSHAVSSAAGTNAIPAAPTAARGFAAGLAGRPYTKWYRVWERAQLSDFYVELCILPFVLLMIAIHVWGTSKNRRRARAWAGAHAAALQAEYASVGFGGGGEAKGAVTADEVQSQGLLQASAAKSAGASGGPQGAGEMIKERKADEYATYATGRQNVAFLDVKLTFVKRYNPLLLAGEALLGFLFESLPAPEERVEATAYAFDGREKELAASAEKVPSSEYDGVVWAVVHKDIMKRMRNDRYDLSLTGTKDHAKLPVWFTVMSEAAEITDLLLTPELVKAIDQAGEALEYLIVTDQPIDQPKKLDELAPRKRITLSVKLPSGTSPAAYEPTQPLFEYFLRMPDQLVREAHWRPEVMRRIRQTREDEERKIKKVDEDEKAEQYKTAHDKKKKEERDAKLKGLTGEQQRKFLEKEREKENRKQAKKRNMKA